MQAASNHSALEDYGLVQQGFGARPGPNLHLAVMGDLHLAPEQMHLFHGARDQMTAHLRGADGQPLPGARVLQLGDLGHGKHASGSTSCFEYAREYLDSFQLPYTLILGNHDLEGDEFQTDEDNLVAWQRVWQQPHHWCADLGPCTAIGLSTVRYRSNAFSHHEVYIDDAQMSWFESQLQRLAAEGRPVAVFTHAPPQGCGLKVVQEVHVKNRCAWLNHSDRPERFMQLVAKYPNIRLWFSGHFHLSHNYQDSISVVGGCAFVQTGVIGTCNRDGLRHSRLLVADATSYRVLTFDHDAPADVPPRLDLSHRWSDPSSPSLLTPPEHLIASDSVAGWLSSQVECSMGPGMVGVRVRRKQAQPTQWLPIGSKTILALQGGLLVEYDMATFAPVGLVCKVPQGCEVVLRTADGGTPDSDSDGSDVALVEVVDNLAGGSSRYLRNEQGGFFVIYQPNKWKLKQAKIKAEREAAAVAARQAAAPASEPVVMVASKQRAHPATAASSMCSHHWQGDTDDHPTA